MRKVNPLRDSIYARVAGVLHKSCPACSRREGVAVLLPAGEFGQRNDGEAERIQTWCSPCRGEASKAARAC